MRRGDIWTASAAQNHVGKPRPLVILQDDGFQDTQSITICPFTTDAVDAPLFRLRVEPLEGNGLRATSFLMVDKITTIPKSELGARIGRLDAPTIQRMNASVLVFLGLAAPARAKPGSG